MEYYVYSGQAGPVPDLKDGDPTCSGGLELFDPLGPF